MATPDSQRFRVPNLNQAPCDSWSTREKLALATSVQKSGDQNWSSVSRSLKSFLEENRPEDWFNYKLCAIQYRDMLDKTECPKRKRERKERSEETPQSIIVKKLTSERVVELTKSIPDKIAKFCELKAYSEKLKTSHSDDELFDKVSEYIQEKTKREKEEQVERDNLKTEREAKVLQLLRRHTRPISRSQTASTPVAEAAMSDNESKLNALDESAPVKRDSKESATPSHKEPLTLLTVSPSASHPSPKSPRKVFDQTDAKTGEKELRQLAENNKNDSNINEVASEVVKTDITDAGEQRNNSNDIVIIVEGTQKENVKNEILVEHDNSNDTIEETFDNAAGKDLSFDGKNELTKSTSKDTQEACKSEESPAKGHPDIKVEEEASVDSSIVDVTNESNADTPKEKVRRRRRKSNKLANASVMQTRSTRSQSHIKTEELKELPIKAESASKSAQKKNRSTNSADENTSVDNTISEESNDAKSSTAESAHEEVVDRKVRKSLNFKLNNIIAHRHSHYFTSPNSDNNYGHIVYKPMNLNRIKQRIHTGQIKSDLELKRDLMLMFSNALTWNSRRTRIYKASIEMTSDILQMFDTSNQKITRTREKALTQIPQIKAKLGRRKTRGSISLDKSIGSKRKN